jgi:hypothetical protein
VSLDKSKLDAAYEAYWANSSGTYTSIEAAILSYLNASQPSPAATVETDLREAAKRVVDAGGEPGLEEAIRDMDLILTRGAAHNGSSADNADELKQCHDDLDTLNVPRLEGGLTLSVPGRILLMARRHRMTLPNADWLRRKTETDPDLECEAGPDLSRDGPQAVSVQQAFEECAALMQRWSDDAAEFSKDNERCQIQANVCRNAAVAIRNLSSRLSRPHSRIGEA